MHCSLQSGSQTSGRFHILFLICHKLGACTGTKSTQASCFEKVMQKTSGEGGNMLSHMVYVPVSSIPLVFKLGTSLCC